MKHATLHVKKGDNVVVISGAAKGQKGAVLRTYPSTGRVVIEGVNMRRKHVRPRKQNEKGQLVMVPYSVHASNVRVLDSEAVKVERRSAKAEKSSVKK